MSAAEHPTVRCACGRGAVDVAVDFDPFAPDDRPFFPMPTPGSVVALCAFGHRFRLERFRYDDGSERSVATTVGRRLAVLP